MESKLFQINFSFIDTLYGKDILFSKRRIELWLTSDGYDQFLKTFETNNNANANTSFSLDFESGFLSNPKIFLRILDGENLIDYSFSQTANTKQFSIIPDTSNNITVYLDLDTSYLAINKNFIKSLDTTYDFNAQLSKSDGTPYSGLSIKIELDYYDNGYVNHYVQPLGNVTTNYLGLFSFSLFVDKQLGKILFNDNYIVYIKYYISKDVSGQGEYHEISESVPNNNSDIIYLVADFETTQNISSKTVSFLSESLGITISESLQNLLGFNGIRTLRDIRSVGGLKRRADTETLNNNLETIQALDAHAQFELLSNDYSANHHVYNSGYSSLYSISTTSREKFVSDVMQQGKMNGFQASSIHRIANAQFRVFSQVFADKLMYARTYNGFTSGATNINNIIELIEDACACDDCEAAVSPLAYLADLLTYTIQHLEIAESSSPIYQIGKVTVNDLETLFCQDFSSYTSDCETMNKRICQYRIAIEVLNCYRSNIAVNQCQQDKFDTSEKEYLETAYYALLEQNGTTFYEVRQVANSNDEKKKQKLADKLGIVLEYSGEYTTDRLYLTFNGSSNKELTNTNLELLFGFRDYTKEASYTQPKPLIETWKEEYNKQRWLNEDANDDIFSTANINNPNYIIDPDILTPDDFRTPSLSNSTYKIWDRRKKFVDKVWKEVFYKEENWMPSGITPTITNIVINADLSGLLKKGQKVRITNSPGNNGVYTVYKVEFDTPYTTYTTISLNERLNLQLSVSAKLLISIESEIDSFGSNLIEVTSEDFFDSVNGSSAVVNDFIEIKGSSNSSNDNTTNDGIYKIIGINTPSNTITLDRSFVNNTLTNNGSIVSNKSFDISSADLINNIVRTEWNQATLIDAAKAIVISASSENNGTYSANSVQLNSIHTDVTDIVINEELKSIQENGNLTFHSIDFVADSITPQLGNRSLIFEVENLGDIISATNTVYVKRNTANSLEQLYTVNSVTNAGAFSVIKVNEVVLGNEVNGKLLLKFDSIVITNNVFSIPNEAIADFFDDLNNPERNKIEINGTEYVVESVENNGSNTDFKVVSSTPLNTSSVTGDTIGIFFIIKEVDTTGKGFEIETADTDYVSGSFKAGDKLIVQDSVFTILSINEDTSNSPTVLTAEVEEIVYDEVIANLNFYFQKTLPVLNAKPRLEEIFDVYNTNLGFSYVPTVGSSSISSIWNISINPSIYILSKRNELLSSQLSSTVLQGIVNEIFDVTKLQRDAFIRLANILNKHKLQATDIYAPRTTIDEYVELFNILIASLKNKFAEEWLNEEQAATVKLNYSDFWISLTEPTEGNPPINRNELVPLLDPELVGRNELPDYISGEEAVELYNERFDYLKNVKQLIKLTRLQYGFEQAIKFGLGGINATDAFPFNLDQLLSKLNNINPLEVKKAEKDITQKLLLSIDDFRFVMQLKARLNISSPPADAEYERLYSVLTTAYKKRLLLADWVAKENDYLLVDNDYSYEFFNYWKLRKATLPKWRATLSQRRTWQNALQKRNRIPLIDPDQVFAEDFSFYTGNVAYLLWNSRRNTLTSLFNTFNTNLSSSIDTLITTALGLVSANELLVTLPMMEEAGIDIRPRLKQLHLSYPNYVRFFELYEAGIVPPSTTFSTASLLPEEREELVNIMLQAYKWRIYYGTWNDVESGQISLSHYFFKSVKPKYGADELEFYSKLKTWRATWKDRRNWEKKLKAREKQRDNVSEMLKTIVEQVEERTLPIIRDALVMYAGNEYASLKDNAKALSDRLLVDFSMTCCQYTTRLSQAIDTIQKLLWTESLGIDKDIRLNSTETLAFKLVADHFEEEWKWMGSYATWRAAMFVFMYPENLLLPSLKRYQSPAFIKLVNDVRGNNRLTPFAACQAAKEYEAYFDDIGNLEPEANCSTTVKINGNACVNGMKPYTEDRYFVFATAKKSGKCYYHTKKYSGNEFDDYAFWQPIEGLGDKVIRIVGSAIYEIERDIRFIYLFAVVHVDLVDKLVYIKYDLEKHYWDQEYSELSLPEDTDFNNILVLQRSDESRPPKLLIKGKEYQGLFTNSLNRKGKDWEKDEWEQNTADAQGKRVEKLYSYVEFNSFINNSNKVYEEVLIAKTPSSLKNYSSLLNGIGKVNPLSNLKYRILSSNLKSGFDDFSWRDIPDVANNERNVNYLGAFAINAQNKEFSVFYNHNNSIKQTVINRNYFNVNNYLINDVNSFNNWLINNISLDLRSITLNENEKSKINVIKFFLHFHRSISNTTFNSSFNLLLATNNYVQRTIPQNILTLPTETALDALNLFALYGRFFMNFNLNPEDFRWDCVSMLTSLCDRVYDVSERTKKDLELIDSLLGDIVISGSYYSWDAMANNGKITVGGILKTFIHREQAKWFKALDKNFNDNQIIRIRSKRLNDDAVNLNVAGLPSDIQEIIHHCGSFNNTAYRAYTRKNSSATQNFAMKFVVNSAPFGFKQASPVELTAYRLNPIYSTVRFPITEEITSNDLNFKRVVIGFEYFGNSNAHDPAINREYLREAHYFVPMFLGIQLSQRGHYKQALKWFKTVYDYTAGDLKYRRIYMGLGLDGVGTANNSPTGEYDRGDLGNWLLDPLNPHQIALSRQNSYYKYTVSTIAQTFLSYANALFTTDTIETVSQATELYEFAIDLLSIDIFKQKPDECYINFREIKESTYCLLRNTSDFFEFKPEIDKIFDVTAANSNGSSALQNNSNEVKTLLTANVGTGSFDIVANIAAATAFADTLTASVPVSIGNIIDARPTHQANMIEAAMSLPSAEIAAMHVGTRVADRYLNTSMAILGVSNSLLRDKNKEFLGFGQSKTTVPANYADRNTQVAYSYTADSRVPNASNQVFSTLDLNAALDAVENYPFPYVPILGNEYCIPENPVYKWAIMSAELNLFKIRNCMNIAGMKRELDPYAAPTDTVTGLPQIGANGQIVLPGTTNIKPTIYRYEYLVERAKQIVGIAQQIEAAFLSALEKRDAEYYSLLKAKQDLGLSKAGVKLKDLQVKVAEGEVDLAVLQKERAQLQVEGLEEMINAGLNEFEQQMINMYWTSASLSATIELLNFQTESTKVMANTIVGVATNAVSNAAAITALQVIGAVRQGLIMSNFFIEAGINVNSLRASQARREQEWNFQKTLANQDIKIGSQQVKVAQDRVRVAGQERVIADLQMQYAEATVDFLNNKFTNAELYEWMSGVLERVYSYFLQEANSTAKLAENQLAFERQEIPAGIIQNDYWETPTDNVAIQTPGNNAPDRRGLTGSARLLQDIYRLDQYAIETDRRKLQISKTFSLATIAPFEFQQFKETGEINFDTLMEFFDRDFPGHYLRLIKKVKTSVIALIPPATGIKATLTSSGISHVVIGGTVFQDMIVRRDPEMVALSGAADATGVFDLQMQDPKYLNPFEGSGVHTRWQFKMPKDANLFNFDTIADVLITIDYTAFHSYDYEQQVLRRLGTDFSADRAFNFRNEFADTFYALTHPDEFDANNRMKVSFDISRFDFPANLNDLRIDQLKFYFITDRTDPTKRLKEFSFNVAFTPDPKFADSGSSNLPAVTIQGSGAVNSNGLTSTLTNGGTLTNLLGNVPVGKWNLDFTEAETEFKNGEILDIVMVITYSGELPKRV